MDLTSLIGAVDDRERELTVFDTSDAAGVERLSAFFDRVTVRAVAERPGIVSRFSAPVPDRDAVAISTIDEFDGDFVLVDPGFRVVGTLPREELAVPEFVVRVDEATFGVAEGNKRLLNWMSRHIEGLALRRGAGRLLTGVQELSRLREEPRTHRTYRELAASGVETHVFGAGDGTPRDGEPTLHASDAAEIAASWFVVFRDGDAGAALVAVETDPNVYRGFWTFEQGLVDDAADYLEATYLE